MSTQSLNQNLPLIAGLIAALFGMLVVLANKWLDKTRPTNMDSTRWYLKNMWLPLAMIIGWFTAGWLFFRVEVMFASLVGLVIGCVVGLIIWLRTTPPPAPKG